MFKFKCSNSRSLCPYSLEEKFDELTDTVKQFWKIEELGVGAPVKEGQNLVPIETDIEPNEKDHFLNDLDIQFVDNRYSVKLPWLENVVSISDNYDLCHCRLDSLFSRLKRDPKLMKGYDEVFVEQPALGIIERVPETDYDKKDAFFFYPIILS